MSELVTILKGGRHQRNVVGAAVADKRRPPFKRRRKGWLLRWWGVDHPCSEERRNRIGVLK